MQTKYDHNIIPPQIVLRPDILQNSTDVYHQDIMVSPLELAGAEKPSHIAFQRFLNLARSESETSYYSAIYGCCTSAQRMIRKGDDKLSVYPDAQQYSFLI